MISSRTRFWQAYGALFKSISEETSDVRAVVLSSAFPDIFTAGLDRAFTTLSVNICSSHFLCSVHDAGDIAKRTADSEGDPSTDPARVALDFPKSIKPFQEAITAPERCLFPVIAALHGMVIGLGVDIMSACDIRYAASNSKFTIKVGVFKLSFKLPVVPGLTEHE